MKRGVKQPANAIPSAEWLIAPDFADALMQWFAIEGRSLPWRSSPAAYPVVVSEFMLQQTQVNTVLPYFEKWLRRFPEWRSLAAADESEVLAGWEGLGYYSRARNLHRLAGQIMSVHGGILPADPAAIRRLPGIGDYAAGAVSAFVFNLPEAAVDANVARVLVRLLDWPAPVDRPQTMAALREIARMLIPEGRAREFNGALMELGALTCIARNPRCAICPVRRFCKARAPGTLPVKSPRRETVQSTEFAWWASKPGYLALSPCPGNARWRGMWRLPLGRALTEEPLLEITFPFTHHQIKLRVFAASQGVLPEGADWIPLDKVKHMPIPAPHRRVINRLL